MKKEKVKKIFAWISLVILIIAIAILLYALITGNGKLSMACIFFLVFISMLLYIVMKIFNNHTKN